jgi:hypothetical protein
VPPEEAEAGQQRGEDGPGAVGRGLRRSVLLAVAALALAILLVAVAWLLVRDGDGAASDRGRAATVSVEELNEFAAGVGHPVYWAGPQPRFTYELTQTEDDRIYIRYLPPGAEAGDPSPNYLTIGTYAQTDALATLRETAAAQGVETFELPGDGVAFQDANRPTSVYLAYPGSDYQVEVYAPSPDTARTLVAAGQIKAVGAPPPTPAGSEAVSVEELERLAGTLAHPLYWAGEEPDTTYELTRTSDGGIYIRYLPLDAEIGAREPDHLTVGTYRLENALEALTADAEAEGVEAIELEGGGLAFADPDGPTSVYLAFPGEDVQVEVYDPDPERARDLVTSGRIVPVGQTR